MNTTASKRLARAFILVVSTAMLVTLFVPSPAEASSQPYYFYPSAPCPNFSVQNVLDDPNGDWDYDRISNVSELYGGSSPCITDTTGYCATFPSACNKAPIDPCTSSYYSYYSSYQGWSWDAVYANPHGDWDGDGVSNRTEAKYGANPCTKPCPNPRYIDLQLNPHGDWDYDGVSNAREVNHGTNPCNSASYYVQYVPYVKNQPQRLPHIETPPPGYKCPAGYPYYHGATGLCYANPI